MLGRISLQLFKLFTCSLSCGIRKNELVIRRSEEVAGFVDSISVETHVFRTNTRNRLFANIQNFIRKSKLQYSHGRMSVCRYPSPPCYISKELTGFLLTSSELVATREHHTLVPFNSLLRWLSCRANQYWTSEFWAAIGLPNLIKLQFISHFAECQ